MIAGTMVRQNKLIKIFGVLVFGILFIVSNTGLAQTVDNDLKRENLNGKVKTVKETSYKTDIIGGQVVKSDVDAIYMYHFNIDGYFSKRELIWPFRDHRSTTIYFYSEINKNRLDKVVGAVGGEIVAESVYEYDTDGNQVLKKDLNDGLVYSQVKYEYDRNNRVIKEIKLGEDEKIISSWEYKYNNLGQRIQMIQYSSSGMFFERVEYIYDAKGREIESKTYYAGDDLPAQTVSLKYDNNGNITERRIKDSDGKETVRTNSYTYNLQRNWIKKTYKNEWDEYLMSEREIEYW